MMISTPESMSHARRAGPERSRKEISEEKWHGIGASQEAGARMHPDSVK